ncbi:MAG: NAD(P)H-binding protein [Gammaproteobacteria bacterium]|uniref:NAD(P)-dependent oxidoreductase n=1 Tax=Pseudomaricurvus alcaniphilus TaxID=1166482 RepID=UPI001409B130|nr:NAD(P)H-binding protein [Pseudomaricurvus alcaniphilus]MBR9910931.1 NAD(P)H-binding protein [Gammaproteobacteria bacterium]NHN37167.1 NAD(P)H-binding protein [Pseudomaricurvus alcaniphilus]
MKITVFGAAGNVGRRVVAEALSRGHRVTAAVRNPARAADIPASVTTQIADIANRQDVARVSVGQDVVVNATRPASGREQDIEANTRGLLTGLTGSGARLLVVGGAASLIVPDGAGRMLLDDPRYLDPSLRHIGQASLDQHRLCSEVTHLDWAYLSPPAELMAGERTGTYRLGGDELLLDREGRSRISMADLAVALLDEIESPRHHQQRFTVAY